jgi:hypothetical protein
MSGVIAAFFFVFHSVRRLIVVWWEFGRHDQVGRDQVE